MTREPFLQGISMPVHGLDHMLVTIAIGLIAAQLGGKALWAIPGIFSVSVLLGGILNIMGIPVPLAEHGILASIAVFGGLLVWGSRLSILLTLFVIALFASCHGNALIVNDSSSATCQYLSPDASFLHWSCRASVWRWDFCFNAC